MDQFYFNDFKFSKEEKSYFYKVVEKYDRERTSIDLSEWKSPLEEKTNSVSSSNNESLIGDHLDDSYLLTLTIKKDKSLDSMIKKRLDTKYCFICNKLDGEVWIKNLRPNEAK